MTINRRIAASTATVALVASAALVTAPADATERVRFGSQLDPAVQPSNSLPGLPCDAQNPARTCTFVMNEAYGRPDGGEVAPVSGKLKRIRVISGGAGAFKLQLTKAREINGAWQAKVKATGPTIQLQGQDQSNWDNDSYKVETFKVNLPIKKGWRLSMKAASTSAVRCSSGGDNTLIFAPPLMPGASFTDITSDDGCWPLIEGVVRRG